MKSKTCKNCKYYMPVGEVGECRRFPPIQTGNSIRMIDEFPDVRADYWCGEFQKKGSEK